MIPTLKDASFDSWDEYFMSMSFFVAMKSKDASSKVGAIIVDERRSIISTGFNGFPRGVEDDVPARHKRPAKYRYTAHAERNAIDNAILSGWRARNCRLYTQWAPCAGCAHGIIQCGAISEVIHHHPIDEMMSHLYGRHDWKDSVESALEMLDEAGVRLRRYTGPIKTTIYQVCSEKVSIP